MAYLEIHRSVVAEIVQKLCWVIPPLFPLCTTNRYKNDIVCKNAGTQAKQLQHKTNTIPTTTAKSCKNNCNNKCNNCSRNNTRNNTRNNIGSPISKPMKLGMGNSHSRHLYVLIAVWDIDNELCRSLAKTNFESLERVPIRAFGFASFILDIGLVVLGTPLGSLGYRTHPPILVSCSFNFCVVSILVELWDRFAALFCQAIFALP